MLSAVRAMIIFNSELKCWCLLLWDSLGVMSLSSDLRGWGDFGQWECLLHYFPCFADLLMIFLCYTTWEGGRSKWNLGSVFQFFLLTLMKDLLWWSFLMQQSCIAWSWFYPRLWKLFQPSRTQFQIFIPQFCVKINQAAFSSSSPIDEWLPVWGISTYFRS